MMHMLPDGDPARQAELFESAKEAATLAPTTSNKLRFALALATPGHSGSDPSPRSDSCLNCWLPLKLYCRSSVCWPWWN